jgi:hypothetical protein
MPIRTCKFNFIQAIIQDEYLSRQKYKILIWRENFDFDQLKILFTCL